MQALSKPRSGAPRAVLTGDLVYSTRVPSSFHGRILRRLRRIFADARQLASPLSPFQIHRGDAFQVVLPDGRRALPTCLFLRCSCIAQLQLDVRISVGIDVIDRGGVRSPGEGSGPAFIRSGRALNRMPAHRRLLIDTWDDQLNQEMDAFCALIDALVGTWTEKECEAVALRLKGMKQAQIASKLKISQPAVNQRLSLANWWAIDRSLDRWQAALKSIRPRAYKGEK